MDFANAINQQLNNEKTITTNGAVAYKTSGHKILDFNFSISALRQCTEADIQRRFAEVFYENPHDAMKFLFYLRDCRSGLGERRTFRVCLDWLANNRPELVEAVIRLVPEYGRWDDLWELLDTDLQKEVIDFVDNQITKDWNAYKEGKSVSLLPKWQPSLNASSKQTKHYAEIISDGLDLTPRQYRKMLSALRAHLNVVETKMCAKEWSNIDYSAVPSRANLIYNNAFLRNDEARRRAYLESLKKGETKINAGVLYPHEIVNKYTTGGGWSVQTRPYDETLEQLWKALPNLTSGQSLVVADGSSSMLSGYGTKTRPIDVATALAIYLGEHNEGIWKDKFITFSMNPKIIDLSNHQTLREKIQYCLMEDECANTDIEKTMLLILETAVANHCSQEDIPETIIIISDTQFDSICYIRNRNTKTLFENIALAYQRYGYQLPRLVFWNIGGLCNETIPMQQNEAGLVLMSGFSINMLNMVMSGKLDPYEVLLDTINGERYQPVENAIKDLV